MATKTFKIGEYARGGVITAEVKKNIVSIIAKDWDTSAGYSKKSDQSNAKEWDRLDVNLDFRSSYWKLYNYLTDLTTHYYAEQVLDWIESKLDKSITMNWR